MVGEIKTSGPPEKPLVNALLPEGQASLVILRAQAKKLEQQADQLRKLAREVHQQSTVAELAKTLMGEEKEIDLLQAALLIARMDNDELDPEMYQGEIERMARDVREACAENASEQEKLEALNKTLFGDLGYHGSRTDYYNKSNSYLNEVIDDREGLPISLSVLYIELARRIGLNVVGVGLPGHFLVRHEPAQGDTQLIDPYVGGKLLSREDAAGILNSQGRGPLIDEHLRSATKREIIVRMLSNLMELARKDEDAEGMLRYVNAIVEIDSQGAETRWIRAVLRFQTERHDGAALDVDWLLEHQPAGINMERVEELRRILDMPH
jgi:regulator of sirC expression with transglutaminase-like and TPR domain